MSGAWLGKAFCKLSLVSFCIYLLVTMDLTLLYILFMFSIILLIAYFDYMLSIVRMPLYSNIRSYSAHSLISWVGGRHRISVVLIPCLPVDAPYILGPGVVRRCDTPVESFIVPSSDIRQVGPGCEGSLALFLIFLSNVPYA